MCLIAYSSRGEAIPRDVLDFARQTNPDGIGIMSADGVRKFFGRKYYKHARRHLRQIAGNPFAIHFRWSTHGADCLELCHPFNVPNSDVFVMHNGVLSQVAKFIESDMESDTSVFVERIMGKVPLPSSPQYADYIDRLEKFIGYGNKLLLFHAELNHFSLVNEDAGVWQEGIWYSNEYSLPWDRRHSWASDASDYDWKGFTSYTRGAAYGAVALPANSVPRSDDYSDRNVADAVDGSANRSATVTELFPRTRSMSDYYRAIALAGDDGQDYGRVLGREGTGINGEHALRRALERRAESVWSDDWPQAAQDTARDVADRVAAGNE